jgi:hypothetical protein
MLLNMVQKIKQTYVLLVLQNMFLLLQDLICECPKGHMMFLHCCKFIGRRLDAKTHYY